MDEEIKKRIQECKEDIAYLKGYYKGQLDAFKEMKMIDENPGYAIAVLLSLAEKSY